MLKRAMDALAQKPSWLLWLIVAVPLLPEYLAPVLALAAFSLSCLVAHQRGETLMPGRVGRAVLLYVAWMSIGVLYSNHTLNTLSTLAMWLVMFALYVAVTVAVTDKEQLERMLFWISVAAGVVGVIAAAQYVLNTAFHIEVATCFWEPLDNAFYKYFPIELDFVVPGAFRTSGTFNNPNIMAEYLVMAMPFICYYAFSKKRTRRRVIARVAMACAVAGVAVSLCRGAYLALLVMCATVVVFRSHRVSTLMLGACATMSFVPQSVFDRFVSIGSGDGSITHRLMMWQEALRKIAERPLFGYGAGVSNTTDMLLAINLDAPHMHNVFLQVLIEGGFPALILLGVMAFSVLRHSMDMHIRRKGRGFGVALIAFVAGTATCGMFDFLFMTPKLVGFFLIAAGLADAGAKVEAGEPISLLVPKDMLPSSRLPLRAGQ